jgi:hypothetical protein
MPQPSNTTALQICKEEQIEACLRAHHLDGREEEANRSLLPDLESFIEEDLDATVYSSGSFHQSARSKHNTTNRRHEELEDLDSLNPHGISPVSTWVDPK